MELNLPRNGFNLTCEMNSIVLAFFLSLKPAAVALQWFQLVQIAVLGYNTLYAKIGFSMIKVVLFKANFLPCPYKSLHVHTLNLLSKI